MDRVQELEAQLAATTDRQQKIGLLNALAKELRSVDPQRGLDYAEEAYRLSTTGPYEEQPCLEGMLTSLTLQAENYSQTGGYGLALAKALEILSVRAIDGFAELKARVLRVVGGTYEHLGNYPDALTFTLKALAVCQEMGDRTCEAHTLNLLGIIHNKLGDYREELAAYEKALPIFQETGRRDNVAAILNNMAMAYHSLGDSTQALNHAYLSLQIVEKMGLRMMEATVLCTIGEIHVQMADTTSALGYFQRAVDLAKRIGSRYIEMYGLRSIGEVYTQLGELDDALPLLQQALAIAEEMGAKSELFTCHRLLAALYRQRQDFETALGHFEQYHLIKADVFNEEADQRLKNLQVIHRTETARKEAEIYRLKNVELEEEITRRKRAEEALRQYAVELEKQNSELDAFAHTVAHDLKNLLNAICLYSGVSEDEFEEMPSGEPLELLQSIDRIARKMSNIIDELLLLSSVRGKDIELQQLDMGRIVGQAMGRLAHLTAQYPGELTSPDGWPAVLGYGPWIEEVWMNYISNALKYGGESPCVELGATVLDDGWVRFWVRDSGPGLSLEEQERLFTPFERLHQARIEGHGLGLSIVQRIVEKLGGRAGVESPAWPGGQPEGGGGPGSTFYFDLPEWIPH